MQLWGGIECTVNRIGDLYYDQVERTGHAIRPGDIELCASIGLQVLRYPVLWERVAPRGLAQADWAWTDDRLRRMRELNMTPIAALVHHGSGPLETHLTDPVFAERLAQYAKAVAERYPWITRYTPVNEPLTTARFAGLYGYWHPHGGDPLAFAQILLNQCRATVLAMRAIRQVNPAAQLIQTEDAGKTHSTPPLAYQAEFQNERRWLTFDLLCGRVLPGHPMHQYLCWLGVPADELDWFSVNTCPPDLLGIDYYVTSDRFLDHRLDKYPSCTHGDNGRDAYADVEAVRVGADGAEGLGVLLREAWDRYHLPMAVTEAHINCSADEQIRWLSDIMRVAKDARHAGVDVRAVTAWALFGLYDWDSLLTRWEGHYEPGAFDVRVDPPAHTPLAGFIRTLAEGRIPHHPALNSPGWWRRPARILYPHTTREIIHTHPVKREMAGV